MPTLTHTHTNTLTAIDVASYECVELLLTKGADPNVADHKGDWPLIIATRKADSTLVRMLLSKGADTTKTDKLVTYMTAWSCYYCVTCKTILIILIFNHILFYNNDIFIKL